MMFWHTGGIAVSYKKQEKNEKKKERTGNTFILSLFTLIDFRLTKRIEKIKEQKKVERKRKNFLSFFLSFFLYSFFSP